MAGVKVFELDAELEATSARHPATVLSRAEADDVWVYGWSK